MKWHDGKPFTAADVKCTWDMVSGLEKGKIRKSPRQAWFTNLESITVNGEHEVTFHLKRPQPSMLALLAAGWSPVYPCHVSSAAMRTKPIGTGPFKFVEFRQNEIIRMERNPDYWKPGLPYLDGIEYRSSPAARRACWRSSPASSTCRTRPTSRCRCSRTSARRRRRRSA